MRTSTMISLKGDKAYIAAFRLLSEKHGKTVAELVRTALDNAYGSDMKPLLDFLSASNGRSIVQTDDKR
jgi:hypothetical protein